ncbi:hypothetical protein [Rhizobium sp. BK379]|uniref:hypothetical protein n=1 Tax=Rhizobium sp. BK379 TaxID=2587059 RepID=UPI001608C0FB|nr:hypothetical protein [Rhizobium sp. BK379]MBB3446428.1 hypothetical protein [Rhizobium sp. BK379]
MLFANNKNLRVGHSVEVMLAQTSASPADLEAAQRRIDAAKARNEERDRLLVQQRRRQFGMVT